MKGKPESSHRHQFLPACQLFKKKKRARDVNFEDYPRNVDLERLQSPQGLIPCSSHSSLTENHKRPNETSSPMDLLPKRLKGSESTFCNSKEREKMKGIVKAGGS